MSCWQKLFYLQLLLTSLFFFLGFWQISRQLGSALFIQTGELFLTGLAAFFLNWVDLRLSASDNTTAADRFPFLAHFPLPGWASSYHGLHQFWGQISLFLLIFLVLTSSLNLAATAFLFFLSGNLLLEKLYCQQQFLYQQYFSRQGQPKKNLPLGYWFILFTLWIGLLLKLFFII